MAPLHQLLEKVSVAGTAGEVMEAFDFTVMANIQETALSFDFGNSEIVLRNLLLAFVPGFNIEKYDKLFGKVCLSKYLVFFYLDLELLSDFSVVS